MEDYIKTPPSQPVGIFKKVVTVAHIGFAYVIQFVFRKYDWEYFWNFTADLWMDINAYHRAIASCRKALESSKSPQALYNIGWCYLHLGKPAMALPYLEEAWEKMREPSLALSLACCHLQLGNDENAKVILDRLETFPPAHVPREWHDYFNELRVALSQAGKPAGGCKNGT